MSDPTNQAQARIKAAADQFAAAMGDAMKLAFRQSVAKQIAEQFGPGPWVLHPDGRVESHRPRTKTQTKKEDPT